MLSVHIFRLNFRKNLSAPTTSFTLLRPSPPPWCHYCNALLLTGRQISSTELSLNEPLSYNKVALLWCIVAAQEHKRLSASWLLRTPHRGGGDGVTCWKRRPTNCSSATAGKLMARESSKNVVTLQHRGLSRLLPGSLMGRTAFVRLISREKFQKTRRTILFCLAPVMEKAVHFLGPFFTPWHLNQKFAEVAHLLNIA